MKDVLSSRLCACGCGDAIPEHVLARARILRADHLVLYASPRHRERMNKRKKRARKAAAAIGG